MKLYQTLLKLAAATDQIGMATMGANSIPKSKNTQASMFTSKTPDEADFIGDSMTAQAIEENHRRQPVAQKNTSLINSNTLLNDNWAE